MSTFLYQVLHLWLQFTKGNQPAGKWNDLFWDGKDDHGRLLSAGLYLIQMKTDIYQERKKVILIKYFF